MDGHGGGDEYIQVSEMGDSGRGQSLMYGDAEEDDLQEQTRNSKTERNRPAKPEMFGDAEEEEDLKPQDKSERKLVEDTGGEELGDKNAKTKKLDNADNLLPQDEDVNVNVVKNMYRKCNAYVMSEGVCVWFFEVHRGVVQGCPLSALLFNFAIDLFVGLCSAV